MRAKFIPCGRSGSPGVGGRGLFSVLRQRTRLLHQRQRSFRTVVLWARFCPYVNTAEPAEKRLKRSLPVCRAHRSCRSGRARQNLPSAVEEALCGVSSLLRDGVYRLQALASAFERDDVSLPRTASFFHQEAQKQQDEAEAMLSHLAARGGSYCGRDIQKPGCEAVCAALPALELLHLQLKEEVDVLLELNQLALKHGDPHTASVVKSHLLTPRVERLKLLGGLLTNARRLGCTSDPTGRFGEYILNELQEELSG